MAIIPPNRPRWTPPPSSMLSHVDADGRPLYKLSAGGNIRRTRKVTKATKRAVLARDGHACVLCGARGRVEIDHIVRYVDGGPNTADNLRTLCKPCHDARQRGDG